MIERARHKPTACLSYVHNQYMYSKLYDLMVWISPAFCVEARKWTGLYGRIWGWNVSPKTTCTYEGKQGGCFLRYFWDVVSGPRASFRYPPSTSPMFTVHLADVHSAPCIVYNSPYTMSREYTSSCLYSLLTVQHTQLLGHLTFFYIDEASPGGISVNGYYYEIIFQPVFCKDHCYLVLKALINPARH